jgi:hypothetical protein
MVNFLLQSTLDLFSRSTIFGTQMTSIYSLFTRLSLLFTYPSFPIPKDQAMFRYLAALILVVALATCTNKSVDARVVHPIVTLEADGSSPTSGDGRRLISSTNQDELGALCQQVAHAGTYLVCNVL